MEIKKIKKFFPIFNHHQETGKQLIYLDSGATAQKPRCVIDTIKNFYETSYATVHRGFYQLSEHATHEYELTREKIARFINAHDSREIIFTKGTTEGINFIAHAWARQHLKQGDEILLSHVEHHANLLPWQQVVQQTGAVLRFIPLNLMTHLLEFSEDLITSKTRLIAVTHSSNVLGEVWGLDKASCFKKIAQSARRVGAKILIDAAQSAPHEKLDIQALGCDFLAFSGHKLYGPTGIGILFINHRLHDEVSPYQWGGTMVDIATWQAAELMDPPYKFEAGTPPVSGVLGLGSAIDFIDREVDMVELMRYEASLCSLLIENLQKIDDIQILGNTEVMKQRGHLVALSMKDIHVHDLASYLGEKKIAVRAGNHCAQPLLALLHKGILLRASFAMYNTEEDIAIFSKELKQATIFFKKY